jgi:ectoine hydroxylase-related dioxygenase (phytanoyl-CoA dioxygenase family)
MASATNHGRTSLDIERFHQEGFLGPFRMYSASQMTSIYERLEREVFPERSPSSGHSFYSRHHDSRLVYDLCTHPTVLDVLRPLYGDDLILWNSAFWVKDRDTAPIPWHQDVQHWPVAFSWSVWIAITDASESNGCLRLIPGSHRSLAPIATAPSSYLFETMAASSAVAYDRAIPVELRAGEFIVFGDRLLHSSDTNRSESDRIGLVARYTLPCVKLFQDVLPFFPGHHAFVASGKDRFQINRVGVPPPAD